MLDRKSFKEKEGWEKQALPKSKEKKPKLRITIAKRAGREEVWKKLKIIKIGNGERSGR